MDPPVKQPWFYVLKAGSVFAMALRIVMSFLMAATI
ncbi:hypothetical protein ABID12_003670, partial [Martelella mangrovi]